ncbi:MAG: ATP-binding protein, partial [Elusimicrobiota bacterium]|nr:ATP-binding protein [Elusimicrobiota bacterium]
LTIIKSLKDETFDIKKDYADVKASNAKLNLKGPKKTEKDNLLKKHEKELKKREGEIIKLHKQLDKSKIEKSELITHERDMKIAFSEKPYRRKIKEAERKLIEKEHRIQNLSLKLENIENEFKKLKSVQGATSDGYIKRSSGNLEDLVAGISHQISNSISIIRSHAEFCLETPEKQKIRESLEAIVRSIIGLQKKIEEISNFSRPGSMQRKTAYLEAVIKDAIVFLREREEFDNIKLTISCVKNLKPLKIDYVRLQEAIEYILLNAVEAMGGKGEVKIELKRVNKQQVIKISDKGCGIESRNLLTVFQPFFTTKPGKIGLGLAIAMNILNAHDGDIKINSELGLGTELILLVPEGK